MAEKRYLEIDYPIIPSGEFHVVKAENVGWGEDDLDDVLQSIEDYLEMHDGNIKNINDSISGLDTRVTALEEGGGGNYPPETGIPEKDLSDDVKQKLNRDLGTQCLYEIDGTTLNITILESGLGTQCNFNLEGNILNISTLGSDASA